MEYLYVAIDKDDLEINRNTFPLKFVLLCFLYLILSISISNKLDILRPIINSKIKNNFNFKENIFPFNKFETGENNTYFNITKIDYIFSAEFNVVQVEYYIGVYDKNGNLIIPSDMAFYSDIHLMCNIKVPSLNLTIDSMASIYKDKYHKCVEFFKISEQARFGLKIYKTNENMDNKYFFLFDEQRFNFNNYTFRNDEYFNPNVIKQNYDKLLADFDDMRINETLKLRQSYETYPYSVLKREALLSNNKWLYRNLYNTHFCMCKGELCLTQNITEKCKYYFYVSIIDFNRDVYPKTEYIFMDFVKADLSSDDTYPVFKEMIIKGYPAHYITGNLDIYKEHCGDDLYCDKILLAPKDLKPIYGDFLEKYIFIFFKLKAMISGRPSFNTDLFYDMEYCTYVCVGHGICYFKDWLFNPERIYGIRRNDKIILPDSDILVDIIKKFGWKEEDIFRVNLPRWDRLYDMEQENLIEAEKEKEERIKNQQILSQTLNNQISQNIQNNYFQENNTYQNITQNIQNSNIALNLSEQIQTISITNNNTNITIENNQIDNEKNESVNTTEIKRKIKTNSILIMFTWRDLTAKNMISYDYFRNFYNLLSSDYLYSELEPRNVTVYISFHRLVREKEIEKFKSIVAEKPLIEFISQQEISECLGRTSLVITDFSSIIFDLMFRKKPYIIYIPDGNDPSIKKLYKPDYWGLIEAMKNGTINFENQFFSLHDTIEKIIFYIQTNFELDPKLERFYQKFGFKLEKSIDKFIDYLLGLN